MKFFLIVHTWTTMNRKNVIYWRKYGRVNIFGIFLEANEHFSKKKFIFSGKAVIMKTDEFAKKARRL